MTAVVDVGTAEPESAPVPAVGHTSRGRRLWRGADGDPRWVRPTLLALLLGIALLYLVGLTGNGWANDYYAAAAQAGSKSWTAWFFGGLDAGGAITVDKPPAALWVMGLSMRLFGATSAALLVPEALMGVATAAWLYGAVRRLASSPSAGLLAAAACAVTPAAVLVFRYDNPDALLVLLLTAAAYFVVRAVEDGRTRWLVFAGTAVGFGFLTKMGQALLIVPGLGAAYLLAGPHGWARRLWQLVLGGLAVILSAGWFVAVVAIWPASDRPYIASSGNNSVLGLALGYNGFGRLLGGSGQGGGGGAGGPGGGAGGGFSGAAGLTRLFKAEMAVEASWLLPAALLALVAGLWLTRRAPRTSFTRAALVLWGGWLVVSGLVFSEMQGTIHPYYTAALAPAIAALVATVGVSCWRQRALWPARAVLAVLVAVTAYWSVVLLHRTGWGNGFAMLAAALGGAVVVALAAWTWLGNGLWPGPGRRLVATIGLAAVLAVGTGSTAWAVGTAGSTQTGNTPNSGPAAAVSQSSFGGGGFGGRGGGPGGGGGDQGTSVDSALVQLLRSTAGYRWAAATTGSMSGGPLALASGASVMSIGGFTGSDNAPTLAQFQAWVAAHEVKYYVASDAGGGGGGRGGGSGSASAIATWVSQHYTATTVGGVTVYDLQPSS